ncbi:MAG: class I SAM-dependent methyltransferase [Calditrichaeota bacterium]|nr:MAG: class I SAM-dependent methyltransferase [Calditrichota bacterium]
MDYIKINKNSWNRKTEIHFNSDFYDNENFLKGQSSLNEIERTLLGEITGKSILHLQCHFGQDTISLNRLGAKATGIDFSDTAIGKANELAHKTKSDATFICCDVYDLPQFLEEKFDIIFTSYGTIGWLPDLNKWAAIIAQFLKTNGTFIFVEFHPVVWMFDDNFKKISYNYFNTGPIKETLAGTYADKKASIKQEYIMWNHSISEVVNNLIRNGLEINALHEFDYSPYDCFNETVKIAPKKFRIKHLNNNIPMVYSVVATRRNHG